MNFLDFVSNLKQKSILPKVYYGTLNYQMITPPYKNATRVFCVAAYDLQEALLEAKNIFFKEIQSGSLGIIEIPILGSIKLGSHEVAEVGTLFDKFIDKVALEKKKPPTKNDLMNRVVGFRDRNLFELYKKEFTKEEIKLIEERLKKNGV